MRIATTLTKREAKTIATGLGIIWFLVVSAGRFVKNGGFDKNIPLKAISDTAEQVAAETAIKLLTLEIEK